LKKLLKAPEGSAQQGFHLVSFGQDENLVIISRVSTAGLANITNPVEGMMVYDTTENCLKVYVNAAIGWKCFNKKTCP